MDQLPQLDTDHLQAAIDWLEQGNLAEANKVLEKISPLVQKHPLVLKARWLLHSIAEDWPGCLELARSRAELAPQDLGSWVDYAASYASLNQLSKACSVLMTAQEQFPDEGVVYYDLACYCCRMRHLEEALRWLRKSFELSDGPELRAMALEDEDLEPVRRDIRDL